MRWRLRALASSLAVCAATFGAIALACERGEPTRPSVDADPLELAAATHADGLDTSLAEARTRLVPSLGQRGVELGVALNRLSAALAEPDRAGLADAVSGADATLARLRATGSGKAADLATVSFILSNARQLLSPTTTSLR